MLDTIKQEITNVFTTVIALLPDLVGALVLLLIGWMLARFLRLVTTRLTHSLNNILAGRFYGTNLEVARIPPSAQQLLGTVVYWATIFIFVIISVRLIGFTGAAGWLEKLLIYLPSLLAGGLIIIGGIILGSVTRRLVTHAAATANIAQPQLLGHVSQFSFIIVGFVIGLSQIGVDVTFFIILFGITLAAVLAGFSLAFGLGARSLVENLIANIHLKQMIKPGQIVATGAIRGRVLEFTATGVILETSEGRSLLPAKFCMDQSLNVVIHEAHDEYK